MSVSVTSSPYEDLKQRSCQFNAFILQLITHMEVQEQAEL